MEYIKNLPFNWCLLRARLREILFKDFSGSAALIAGCRAPQKFESLRDAYLLRMQVLSASPQNAHEVLLDLSNFRWFQAPASPEDRYAAAYCQYMLAALSNNHANRRQLEKELHQSPVSSLYKEVLKVT